MLKKLETYTLNLSKLPYTKISHNVLENQFTSSACADFQF